MKSAWPICLLVSFLLVAAALRPAVDDGYTELYQTRLRDFGTELQRLEEKVDRMASEDDLQQFHAQLARCRLRLKGIDFWLRYYEPNAYKQINGPLPVEWETEVFEKYEKPYKREGAGLSLAELYLDEDNWGPDSLRTLIRKSRQAMACYSADSIAGQLRTHDSFFLCNRLFLLNLATIYTTGFECPDPKRIIPELQNMLAEVEEIYFAYDRSFPAYRISPAYHFHYRMAMRFVQGQPLDGSAFDHFAFVRSFVNLLYGLNQDMIAEYRVASNSNADYSLRDARSIFDKGLFFAQNDKGIYANVQDANTLKAIDGLGKLLFYDPILSGNNRRSCASCHQPRQYFADTLAPTALQFDGQQRLTRNTPTLLNVVAHHLIMLDGKLLDLQQQAKAVITNPIELGGVEAEVVAKVLSCPTYKRELKRFQALTFKQDAITLDHIVSAITLYYGKFSRAAAPFDAAMNQKDTLPQAAIAGYNLFMGKAQCGTCHFAPTFSGIKPPYIGDEFEVIGTPADTHYRALSPDRGRYDAHPARETLHAFRTPTLRNVAHTAPYMHNGSFPSLDAVLELYNGGGGAGHHLAVPNQTLSSDSLHLSVTEKQQLIAFLHALTEDIPFEAPPTSLPRSTRKELNARKVGGEY